MVGSYDRIGIDEKLPSRGARSQRILQPASLRFSPDCLAGSVRRGVRRTVVARIREKDFDAAAPAKPAIERLISKRRRNLLPKDPCALLEVKRQHFRIVQSWPAVIRIEVVVVFLPVAWNGTQA